MNVRIALGTLALASLLSLTPLGGPIGSAQARAAHHTKAECKADGYTWSDTLGCADRWCPWPGGYVAPGTIVETNAEGGTWMCDGFVGKVIYLPPPRMAPPSQPVKAPSGGTLAQP